MTTAEAACERTVASAVGHHRPAGAPAAAG
ncbi:MAG: hypothetical protein Q605_AUC00500G0003, partial [Actinomyces urogenitalis DORA_12]